MKVFRLPLRSWINMLAYLANVSITYGSLTGAFGATNEELSEKYQTIVTPAGYAFAIWGPIFIWEGIFAVAQMFPSLSTSPVVETVTPWWNCACLFQIGWTLFFAQDMIQGALVCMLGILVSLLTLILRTDYLPEISIKEYFLLRAPFSLHCGWIIAASVLNINVLADYNMSSQETMLMFAMVLWLPVIAILRFQFDITFTYSIYILYISRYIIYIVFLCIYIYIYTVCIYKLMCACVCIVFALILEHSCLGCLGGAACHVFHTLNPTFF